MKLTVNRFTVRKVWYEHGCKVYVYAICDPLRTKLYRVRYTSPLLYTKMSYECSMTEAEYKPHSQTLEKLKQFKLIYNKIIT